jgi:hypothetical protein
MKKLNPPLEISTSLLIKLDRNTTLILEEKRKNYRRDLSISVMFMYVSCEECIETALFEVTLLTFFPANWPSRSLRPHTVQWYMNVDTDWIKISGGSTEVLQWS